MTAIDPRSKPDTVLLTTGVADYFVDESQYRTDLDDWSSYYEEPASARTAIEAPREITIHVTINTTDSGFLIDHGGSYQIQVSAGVVSFAEGGSVWLSMTIPGLVAGDRRAVLVHWSKRPHGTGARSEGLLYNYTTGAFVHGASEHVSTTPSAADTLTLFARNGGVAEWTGGILGYRIGRRFHSGAEVREDWIGQRTPPAVTARRRAAYLSPDRATVEIFGEGNLAGPQYLWAGHAYRNASPRLVSPLVNMRTPSPAALNNTYSTGSVSWYRTPPGSSVYHMTIAHLFCSPVPAGVNRARVRIFVQQTTEGAIGTTWWRMYSIANLATIDDGVAAEVWSSTTPADLFVDHGSDAGEWIDLGDLVLRRDDLGFTWLALAHSFGLDTGSPGEAATTARVKAITVEPFYEPPAPGGYDLETPP